MKNYKKIIMANVLNNSNPSGYQVGRNFISKITNPSEDTRENIIENFKLKFDKQRLSKAEQEKFFNDFNTGWNKGLQIRKDTPFDYATFI